MINNPTNIFTGLVPGYMGTLTKMSNGSVENVDAISSDLLSDDKYRNFCYSISDSSTDPSYDNLSKDLKSFKVSVLGLNSQSEILGALLVDGQNLEEDNNISHLYSPNTVYYSIAGTSTGDTGLYHNENDFRKSMEGKEPADTSMATTNFEYGINYTMIKNSYRVFLGNVGKVYQTKSREQNTGREEVFLAPEDMQVEYSNILAKYNTLSE